MGTPISGDINGFRRFAAEIDAATRLGDPNFFLSRLLETELVCRGDEALGQCGDHPPGTVLRGVQGSAWKSDASYIFTPEEYTEALLRYFAAERPSQSDGYGDGSLKLHGLGSRDDAETIQFLAITTSIVEEYTTGKPIGAAAREAHVFAFVLKQGEWRFIGETVATGGSSSDWLSGTCPQCYDYWEPWEGS